MEAPIASITHGTMAIGSAAIAALDDTEPVGSAPSLGNFAKQVETIGSNAPLLPDNIDRATPVRATRATRPGHAMPTKEAPHTGIRPTRTLLPPTDGNHGTRTYGTIGNSDKGGPELLV